MIAESLRRIVLPALRPRVKGRRVLDVGAGGGRLALGLADTFSVVGADPSRSQAKRFQRRARSSASIVRAEGESLPFSTGSFDTVYSSCVFKHWPSPEAALRVCLRVARPGASVITVEIDGAATSRDFRRFADRSRVPLGLRAGYVRFAMRTIVGVAPTGTELAAVFDHLAVQDLRVVRIADMPFLIATATAR
jgi:ubiquinone/menaquinone biosynthesis C-methylase UbiE